MLGRFCWSRFRDVPDVIEEGPIPRAGERELAHRANETSSYWMDRRLASEWRMLSTGGDPFFGSDAGRARGTCCRDRSTTTLFPSTRSLSPLLPPAVARFGFGCSTIGESGSARKRYGVLPFFPPTIQEFRYTMNDLFRLDDDVAVVIGGTGELGGMMAEALGAAGAKVAVVGRSAERGNAEPARSMRLEARPSFLLPMASTLSRSTPARESIRQWSGGPASVLINAAGGNRPDATIPPGGDFCKLPLDAWRDVFDLNLVGGALLPSPGVWARHDRRRRWQRDQHRIDVGHDPAVTRGRLFGRQSCGHQFDVVVGSRVGHHRCARQCDQPRVLSQPSRIESCYSTRTAATPIEADRSSGTRRWRDSAKPEELAGVVVWLASRQASSFVTGQNIAVDGGFASVTI